MRSETTHRLIKNPKISARFLADFMAGSETAKRTIVRDCKYLSTARVIQHDEAKAAIATFMLNHTDPASLEAAASRLRSRIADSDFDRDLYDHNAEYISQLAKVHPGIALPAADILPEEKCPALTLRGVAVTMEINFRLRRLTRTNKVCIGAGMLRYAKGKSLAAASAEWQSAFLLGYLEREPREEEVPERKLCLTIDAFSGSAYGAPSDSIRRFKNMESACETIAERWPNVKPPPGAIL